MDLLRIQLLIAISMVFAGATSLADVYTWTDAAGQTHYSDIPRSAEDQTVKIKNKRTDNQKIALAKQEKLDNRIANETTARQEQERMLKQQEIHDREVENCKRATNAMASLNLSQRLFVPDGNGGRRYLNESEIVDRKARAQADIDEWCQDSN